MGKAKVHYEKANAQGVLQDAGHRALKVQLPRSRRRGRSFIQLQQVA